MDLTRVNESDLKYWIEATQRFDSKQKKFEAYNLLFNEIENEFHHFLREHRNDINKISAKDIRDHLLNRNKPNEEVYLHDAIWDWYNTEVLNDGDKTLGTKKNYKKSLNHFSNFLKRAKLKNLRIEDFKRFHANKFMTYLKQSDNKTGKIALKGQSVNSVIKNIKPYFSKLQQDEAILSNPFHGIRATEKKIHKPRLSNEDFKRIVELDLSNDLKLDVYRDLFLFLCFTGLSYCDATNLRYEDVKNGKFQLYRKKSNVSTRQFFIRQSWKIILKYEGLTPESRILPKRSLDKLNLNLKLIAVKAGISYNLTSYSARRFFRQSIHQSGIREALVVKTLMGHTRSNDMDHHYFLVDDNILIKAKKKLQKHYKKLLK
ncbi:tyrosine-type recombinase/integrase [Winogradskyella tangerina]|uniref:tyrosine-type recombinase/integrase n=1 Tax=Winogradskyella tangerina TaxID=2023240 RepID=UPI0013001B03|nr:phage integrase SAM-like domain-containing protein [Winogradskyella tangerina]